MPMKIDSLEKLLLHELKDIYSAEEQIVDVLPEIASAAVDEELKTALREHLNQTRGHVKRLDKVFELIDGQPGGQRCHGMEGLIEEVRKVLEEEMPDEVRDAALVGAAQRIEHYEVAAYGVARAFAERLGLYEVADLLQETLNEEGEADRKLTRIAERHLNFRASSAQVA